MIYSMTAFGRSVARSELCSVTVEIRALNSRHLDIVLKMPKNCIEFEDHCRKLVAKSVRRGRLEVNVQLETKTSGTGTPAVNLELAKRYWGELQELHRLLPQTDPPRLEHLLCIPYLFQNSESAIDREDLQVVLTEALLGALNEIQCMKALEGKALLQDFMDRLATVRRELSVINGHQEKVLRAYELKLREKVQQFLGETPLDENRLIQEVVYFADRSDINEEIVRLRSHLDQVENILTSELPADGRKLDFLLQEMHREINTIGAKTADLDIITSVVVIKTEIGKLKEQIQNVE